MLLGSDFWFYLGTRDFRIIGTLRACVDGLKRPFDVEDIDIMGNEVATVQFSAGDHPAQPVSGFIEDRGTADAGYVSKAGLR
jgi:hypothetical protein